MAWMVIERDMVVKRKKGGIYFGEKRGDPEDK
jgi:hypothetical protein